MTAELTIAKSLRALGIKAMKSASQVLSKGPVHLEMLVRTNLFHLSAAEQLKNYTILPLRYSCVHAKAHTKCTSLLDAFHCLGIQFLPVMVLHIVLHVT